MTDLVASLANCVTSGEIHLRLGRQPIVIRQLPSASFAKLDGYQDRWMHTTEVTVQDAPSRGAGERVAIDLSHLLSLATMSQVTPFRFAFGSSSRTFSTVAITSYRRPTVDCGDATALRSFLEAVWPFYRRLKRKRLLPEVIDYVVTATLPLNPTEMRLLLTFVAMENLKATYARTHGIPETDKGFHRVSAAAAAGLTKKQLQKKPVWGLEALLLQMLGEVRMQRRLRRLVKLRNQIVHTGLSTWTLETRKRMLDQCHDILREYLLRLLHFRGDYLVYSTGSRVSHRL